MTLLIWQDDMDTGIDIIDGQHRRIVEMINHLHITQKSMERFAVGEVIDELVDYTLSHFAFEEELMEEAGYPFSAAHKRVHEVFTKRVSEYRLRFEAGEDIVDDLRSMLSRWLFNHIRNDDRSYTDSVKLYLKNVGHGDTDMKAQIKEELIRELHLKKKRGFFARLFGSDE